MRYISVHLCSGPLKRPTKPILKNEYTQYAYYETRLASCQILNRGFSPLFTGTANLYLKTKHQIECAQK